MNTVIYPWQVFNKTKYHLKYLLLMLNYRFETMFNITLQFKIYYEY